MIADVEWRPIPGLPDYAAGSNGVILSFCRQYGVAVRALTPHTDRTGYQRVNAAGRSRLTHRLVASAFGISGQVDHRDRNRGNPALVNLRAATRSQNGANTKTRNKLGVKGVHPIYGGRYRAVIRVAGKLRNLGSFDSISLAQAAYRDAADAAFGQFACCESAGRSHA